MDLRDTVDLMLSESYEDRLKAEYYQLTIRLNKLNHIIEHYNDGTLDFEPNIPLEVLQGQAWYMDNYRTYLLNRMSMEGVDICE